MGGISGIITTKSISGKKIASSLKAIVHRGTDDTFIFDGENAKKYSASFSSSETKEKYSDCSQENAQCWLGLNSFKTLSDNVIAPFFDANSGCICFIDGKIFNLKEIKGSFLKEFDLTESNDFEIIIRLYLKLGDTFIEHLRGEFAIVIFNTKTKKLNAWRDRFGLKPFYYFFQDNTLVFSSEMKGIFATEFIAKEPDFTGIAYSMFLGTCPVPKTIYKAIRSLQAAHFLEFDTSHQRLKTQNYWSLKYTPSAKEFSRKELLSDIDKLSQLYADNNENAAITLSGGLDSGVLAFYLAKKKIRI